MRGRRRAGGAHLLALLALAGGVGAQEAGSVVGARKLSDRAGGFEPDLHDFDQLGRSVACLGDLDGDGVVDIASSGHGDDDGGPDRGAVYVIFLRPDGRALRTQKISQLSGGFGGELGNRDQMGRALAALGDLDGDGVTDLAAGANFDDDGGFNAGAVWILFLNPDGTVKGQSKVSALEGGLTGVGTQDEFGRALAGLGDLDGDGVPDLAAAAPYDDDGGDNKGAVYILFLNRDGSVKAQRKISSLEGGFGGRLGWNDLFGFSLCNPGDLDRDGIGDLVVGAALDDDGAFNAGAIWILFLNRDGSVKGQQKISAREGGFTGVLESPDQFGVSVAAIGDLDADGRTELAVGAVKDGDGGPERGAVWILFLDPASRVREQAKISALEGGFPYSLDDLDWFGSALAPLGDLNGDLAPDLVVGARNDDDGGSNRGALYVTFLHALPPVPPPARPSWGPSGYGSGLVPLFLGPAAVPGARWIPRPGGSGTGADGGSRRPPK